jgi:hypothetical protein
MLRWTNRLRDTLELRDDWVESNYWGRLFHLREAEFEREDDDEDPTTFPTEFDWTCFDRYYRRNHQQITLRTDSNVADSRVYRPILDPYHSQVIRPLPGQRITEHRQTVDIFWLSPKVFISSIDFSRLLPGPDYTVMREYEIILYTREDCEFFHLFAYSLSTFEDPIQEEQQMASPLPIRFVRHLAELLPVDFFSILSFTRYSQFRVPVAYFVDFLSSIPYKESVSSSLPTRWTTFALGGHINSEELRIIFSHRFHPDVQLSFIGDNPLDQSVSLLGFLALLLESICLQSVQLPATLIRSDLGDQSLPFEELYFKSRRQTIQHNGLMSLCSLVQITLSQDTKELDMVFPLTVWREHEFLERVRGVFQYVLLDCSSLQRVTICFEYSADHIDLSQFLKWASSNITVCMSKRLCHFTVSFKKFQNGKMQPSPSVKSVKSWDQLVSPSLVLNLSANHLTMLSKPGIISLSMKAINEGVVYRKTTDHVPHDMTIANAGLIYHIVQDYMSVGSDERESLLPRKPAPETALISAEKWVNSWTKRRK